MTKKSKHAITPEHLSGDSTKGRKGRIVSVEDPVKVRRLSNDPIFEDSFFILQHEISRLKMKSFNGDELSPTEVRKLKVLTEVFTKLTKERREEQKLDRFDLLTNEQLDALILEAENGGNSD